MFEIALHYTPFKFVMQTLAYLFTCNTPLSELDLFINLKTNTL